MRTATREALAASQAALTQSGPVELPLGEELLAVARLLARSPQLRAALADPAAEASAKGSVVDAVFASLQPGTRAVLRTIVSQSWSRQSDLVAAVDEIGVRAVAASVQEPEALAAELFAFEKTVLSDGELELTLGSKLSDADEAKHALVTTLLQGRVSDAALVLAENASLGTIGGGIGRRIARAAELVLDQAGLAVAQVEAAQPLNDQQREALTRRLEADYGRKLYINVTVEPQLIGGLRVRVGDEVADGTIASRLADLRLQLAG